MLEPHESAYLEPDPEQNQLSEPSLMPEDGLVGLNRASLHLPPFSSRFPPSLFPRFQHHPGPEGAFPHVSDRGAAAGSGGADGGRVHALHHHQAVRLLPVRHQRHHVTGHGTDSARL